MLTLEAVVGREFEMEHLARPGKGLAISRDLGMPG